MLTYNDSSNEHRCIADDLGLLLGGIDKGRITKGTPDAFYKGRELNNVYPGKIDYDSEYCLKKDSVDQQSRKGHGQNSRSSNRVIVKIGADGRIVAGEAWLWRHDGRVEALGSGFFDRAQRMRLLV